MRVYLDYKILIAKKAQKILENLDIVERTKIVVKVKLLNTENIKTLNIKSSKLIIFIFLIESVFKDSINLIALKFTVLNFLLLIILNIIGKATIGSSQKACKNIKSINLLLR